MESKSMLVKKTLILLLIAATLFTPLFPFRVAAETAFNPHFIISDEEMQSVGTWSTGDIQRFLESKNSYLARYVAEDMNGIMKSAAEIIFESARHYQINPKYLLVTLQKEQSLITDDTPTQKQLDWATGYGVCDSCSLSDPNVLRHKGFGKQVDNAAGVIRWYYNNSDRSYIKKKDQPTLIDNQPVIPQSWATAFLYTYTPHLHGNKNFWRIWQTWFSQIYPNGSLLQSASSSEVWLVQNGMKRKFKNRSALISRADPSLIVLVPDIELNNYQAGPDITFSNYSILKAPSGLYLVDYDTLRPFVSEDVFRQIGYNPDEIIEVAEADLSGYTIGKPITTTTTPPQGVMYYITDAASYYLFKDDVLYPVIDKNLLQTNFKQLTIEKKKLADIKHLPVADMPIPFQDGTLLNVADSNAIYVIENGKKRKIVDEQTFAALGYKKSTVVTIPLATAMTILEGEPLFLNTSLISSRDKFLGDTRTPVDDLFTTKLPAYLVAEYPNGRIIAGKNIDRARPIASITKVLVAYEVLQQDYPMKKTSTYNQKKHGSSGHVMKLREGVLLKNADLFNAMVIGSTNNTARMVAQATGKSEAALVSAINKRLDQWGADNSRIVEVTGLDEHNVSTPRDLLKIFTKVLAHTTIKETLAKERYTFRELPSKNGALRHTVNNTNKLLATPGRNYRIIASKTGYTDEAGSVMIMLIESRKTKQQHVVITLGNTNYKQRFNEPNKLAQWIASGTVNMANK